MVNPDEITNEQLADIQAYRKLRGWISFEDWEIRSNGQYDDHLRSCIANYREFAEDNFGEKLSEEYISKNFTFSAMIAIMASYDPSRHIKLNPEEQKREYVPKTIVHDTW